MHNARQLIGHRAVFAALFICFFLSGAAALLYEVVWVRMLTQIFGSTAYAVATVLAGFMAGLALGSYVFGRIVDRKGNYLRLYGWLEVGIGLYGFLVPQIFKGASGIYGKLFWLHQISPFIFNCALFLLAFALLAVPTFLMGATLPVLSRFFIQSLSQLGRRIGDLYGTNTLGAVAGCGMAGYYLIPTLGIRGTLYSAAALNVIIAGSILIVDWLRKKDPAEPSANSAPTEETAFVERPTWVGLLILVAIGLSGAAAMIFENVWTHALTMIIGGSVYSFTTMLLTFLIGLATGGYLYARLFGGRFTQVTSFGLVELGIGAAALATIPLFQKLPLIFVRLHAAFGDSFPLFLAIQVAVSFLVMFPSTLLFGMTFPMVVRLVTQSLYRVGSSVGTVYAVNTVGAIAGAFAGGFVFLPLFGIQQSIVIGAFINLTVGYLLIMADPHPGRARRLALGSVAAAALLVLALRLPTWDPRILTSGVTVYASRYKGLPTDSLRLEEMRQDQVLYYREGLTATVSVHRLHKDYLYLKTNGKTDGSYGDSLTMLLTGYIPMFLKPEAKDVAIIGLGTGMTVKAVGAFPVASIKVLEIEPAMAEAATFFKDKIGGILKDRRLKIVASDGRNYMLATPQLYDLIISEPSNPWIAGIASLFTQEFYAVAKGKLKPGGIFAQWIHVYSMSPDDFLMVLRTFADAFPHLSVWNMQESDFLLIGSSSPLSFDYPRARKIFAANQTIRSDFQTLGFTDPYALRGFYRMSKKELSAFTEGAELNTDDNVRLEFSAPRSLGKPTSELNRGLMQPHWIAPSWEPFKNHVSQAQHHYFIAQSYYANGAYEPALAEAGLAIGLDEKNPGYYLLQSRILSVMERPDEAFQAAKKTLDLRPTANQTEILALCENFYTRDAAVIYRRIIEAGSKELLPFTGLADIALHARDMTQAGQWLDRAAQIDAKHPKVLFARGKLERAKGNLAEAIALFEDTRKTGEDSASLFSELGEAYSQTKQWEKAAAAYEMALRRHRKNTAWRLAWARALHHAGKHREAEEKYRELLAINPDFTDAWRGLRALRKRF
jgi:spermidine synthase